MEANAPKRKEARKSLRIKVISMGNAEVGKVRGRSLAVGTERQASCPIGSGLPTKEAVDWWSWRTAVANQQGASLFGSPQGGTIS